MDAILGQQGLAFIWEIGSASRYEGRMFHLAQGNKNYGTYVCIGIHVRKHTGACTCVCTRTCLWPHVHSHTCVSACARVCVPFVKQEQKAKWEEPGAEPVLQAGACRAWNEGPGGDGEIGVTCPPRTLEAASWLPVTHLVDSFLVPTTCPAPC